MTRHNDESGVSGTGQVLEGSIFGNGSVVVYWMASDYNSFGIYKNFYEFYAIHVGSHPSNNTVLTFDEDFPVKVKKERRNQCRHCKNPYESHPKDIQWEENGLRRSCSGNLVELLKEDAETADEN
jgi:hypothetical protein